MHIILVSDRLATARTITLSARHLVAAAGGLLALVLVLASLFSYLTVRHAAEVRLPILRELLSVISAEQTQSSREFVRENLNVMAVRLGQMQAQLARLDSLGERLAGVAGVKLQELKTTPQLPDAAELPGRGGPLVRATPLSTEELRQAVDNLSLQLESRSDVLAMLENQLFEERVRKIMLPTSLPVNGAWNASTYGWRIDPFTGERAMHEGVDFPSDVGTAINAAAAGVVITAEYHPAYGNMVEIDHGNDLTTRYAHASKLHVKLGAVVKRGQKIAEVGTTGRSTGPHLHFEVRYQGSPQNPNRFLQNAQANSLKVTRTRFQ
ncbi:MAG: M23 family metallopeptidase [Rhodocyclaceae bacterium]|nr:M23 family metallopeptidase [Rhodocyclaceae bacterium]